MPVTNDPSGSLPAAVQPDTTGRSGSSSNHPPNNPSAGPYFLARLLANLPVSEAELVQSGASCQAIIVALLPVPPEQRRVVFDELLIGHPDASAIRLAVFQIDPTAAMPELPAAQSDPGDCQELPNSARLPADWEDSESCSWLQHYLTFARLAAPMSDNLFHLSVALALLSIAVARRVYLPVSILRLFPNLYQLIVAESTLYHKTTALAVGEALLKKAGLDTLLLASRQTPESLVAELSTQRPPTFDTWNSREKERWLEERRFSAQRGWMLDEASHLLDSFNRDYTAGLLPLTLGLYECPEREAAQTVGRGRQTVHNAYLTILGATTPSALGEHIQRSAHWSNGLWARFCLVTPQADIPDWHFFPRQVEIPEDLAVQLNSLAFHALPVPQVKELATGEVQVEPPDLLPIDVDPAVLQAWEAYAKALGYDLLLEGGVDRRLWSSYGRMYISAMKVAMLLATSDWALRPDRPDAPAIQPAHWYQAQAIAEGWRLSAHRLLNDASVGTERSKEDNLLRILRRAGTAGLTAREAGQRAHLPRLEVETLLASLEQDGLAERFQPAGRRAVYFRLAGGE